MTANGYLPTVTYGPDQLGFLLFRSIGASVVCGGDRLQLYFRDVQMYRVHFQLHVLSPMLRAQTQLVLPLPMPFHL